tara:strand:+ start:47 stop:457 length:411 start_codon:yes stop_codon:yes gene_type:complete
MRNLVTGSIIIGLLLVGWQIAAVADSDTQERLQVALDPWNPHEIRLTGNQLTVITRERRMTDQVLRPLISTGVCMPVFTGAPDSYLSGIDEIAVLNIHGRQGYIFSGGRSECQEIGGLPMNDLEMYILSRTRMHTN